MRERAEFTVALEGTFMLPTTIAFIPAFVLELLVTREEITWVVHHHCSFPSSFIHKTEHRTTILGSCTW